MAASKTIIPFRLHLLDLHQIATLKPLTDKVNDIDHGYMATVVENPGC